MHLTSCSLALWIALLSTAPGMAETQEPPPQPTVGARSGDGKVRRRALPRVDVTGQRQDPAEVAGMARVLSREELRRARVFTINEALRKVPGVVVRDEEGFGIRPNIGIRGLNPTRSTKISLLEDGTPLAYAPYGDNASYYHPQIDRYAQLEVLKGAHSLLFGPQSIGGVINYITPEAPLVRDGYLELAGGGRDYRNAHLQFGGAGFLLDLIRKQGAGSRDHLEHRLDDLNLKYTLALAERQALTARANFYREDSIVTYSGLTLAEFQRLGPRYNPFKNDTFDVERRGYSLTHQWLLGEASELTTNVYLAYFDRDWWRQSSNSQDGLHAGCNPTLTIDGVSATITQHRLAGRAIDPSTQVPCAQGRLRSYTTYGLEPRLTLAHDHGRVLAGIKLHREEQERLQVNAGSALGRSGAVVEDNLRESRVLSAFLGHEFEWGALSALPVLRHERIDAERRNRLNGTVGLRRFTATLYGLGLRYRIDARTGLFASLHRGFAPPRVEDLIGGTGTVTDVDPERSVNLELGFRTATDFGLSLEAALFRNDFANLIAVGSIAGGGTPLSEGEALFAGFELDARWDLPAGWFARLAYAYLPTAEQSTPFINVATRQPIAGSAAGLRQPYAPRHSGALSFGYATEHWDLSLEAQHLGRQYTDFANTVAVSADGQRGVIGGTTVYNLATNIRLGEQIGAFVAVKNLGDKVYVTDRTRGIQVGQPRLLQLGLRYGF